MRLLLFKCVQCTHKVCKAGHSLPQEHNRLVRQELEEDLILLVLMLTRERCSTIYHLPNSNQFDCQVQTVRRSFFGI